MSTRGIGSANNTEANAVTCHPVFLWYGDFPSGVVRITSHIQDISWGGNTWTALGTFVGMSEIKETSDPQSNSVEFFMNGVQSSILVKALEAGYRRRACILYVGFLSTLDALVGDPIAFPYIMDRMPVRRNGEESKISVIAESRLVDMQRSSELRCTDLQHQYLYAGDTFFKYVEGIQEKDMPIGGTIAGGQGAGNVGGKGFINGRISTQYGR